MLPSWFRLPFCVALFILITIAPRKPIAIGIRKIVENKFPLPQPAPNLLHSEMQHRPRSRFPPSAAGVIYVDGRGEGRGMLTGE